MKVFLASVFCGHFCFWWWKQWFTTVFPGGPPCMSVLSERMNWPTDHLRTFLRAGHVSHSSSFLLHFIHFCWTYNCQWLLQHSSIKNVLNFSSLSLHSAYSFSWPSFYVTSVENKQEIQGDTLIIPWDYLGLCIYSTNEKHCSEEKPDKEVTFGGLILTFLTFPGSTSHCEPQPQKLIVVQHLR